MVLEGTALNGGAFEGDELTGAELAGAAPAGLFHPPDASCADAGSMSVRKRVAANSAALCVVDVIRSPQFLHNQYACVSNDLR